MPLNKGEYDDVLQPFQDAMRYKLSNSKRYAGTRAWESVPVADLVEGLKKEVAELEEAMIEGTPIETVLEAVDVANFAMMIADRYGMRHIKQPGPPAALHGSGGGGGRGGSLIDVVSADRTD